MRLPAPLCPAHRTGTIWTTGRGLGPSRDRPTLEPREGEGARKVTQRIWVRSRREGPRVRARLPVPLRPDELPTPSPPLVPAPPKAPTPCPCSHPRARGTAQGGSPRRAPPPPCWSPRSASSRQPSPPPARLQRVAEPASAPRASIPEARWQRRSAARGGKLSGLAPKETSPAQLRTASRGPHVRTRERGLGWSPRMEGGARARSAFSRERWRGPRGFRGDGHAPLTSFSRPHALGLGT